MQARQSGLRTAQEGTASSFGARGWGYFPSVGWLGRDYAGFIREAVRSADRDRRNGMFENQLFLIVGFQHNRVLIERANTSGQLHSAHQINRDAAAFLASGIEEGVLNVLPRRLTLHADLLYYLTVLNKPYGF